MLEVHLRLFRTLGWIAGFGFGIRRGRALIQRPKWLFIVWTDGVASVVMRSGSIWSCSHRREWREEEMPVGVDGERRKSIFRNWFSNHDTTLLKYFYESIAPSQSVSFRGPVKETKDSTNRVFCDENRFIERNLHLRSPEYEVCVKY